MAKKATTKDLIPSEDITNPEKKVHASKGKAKRNFPLVVFEEAFELAKALFKIGAGEKVRRITLFDEIKKSPDSSASRMLITNSGKYGLTKGSYQAEFLELTDKGKAAVAHEETPILSFQAKIELAITDIEIYNFLYSRYAGNKLPSTSVISDLLLEQFANINLTKEEASTIIEIFIVNLKYLGLLQTIAGAERILTVEHALEGFSNISTSKPSNQLTYSTQVNNQTVDLIPVSQSEIGIIAFENLDNVCFYITPIGEENSEFRKHSDLFLEAIIVPALQQFDIKVIRADKIDKPGTITNQIIEYIFKSKLVIADLSFHNPNVFYELALRHACRLPTVQIIRKADRIPFDLSHSRTITIDTTDIYTLVPKLETYKTEIASQVRQVLTNPDSIDNPVTNVFPGIKLTT